MKKTIFTIACLLLLYGCQPQATPNIETEKILQVPEAKTEEIKSKIQDEKAIVEAFYTLVQEDVAPIDIHNFLEKHISRLTVKNANKTVVTYLDRLMLYSGKWDGIFLDPKFQDLCEPWFESGASLDTLDSISDPKFVELVKSVYSNGMVIKKAENIFVLAIDFERLMKQYGNEVGKDIFDYINLMQSLYEKNLLRDNVDRMNEIAMEVISHEHYLETYPNSIVRERIRKQKKTLCHLYFFGEESKVTSAQADEAIFIKESFSNIHQLYPHSQLAAMIDGYRHIDRKIPAVDDELKKAYIDYYDSLFSIQGGSLDQKEIKGHIYPVFLDKLGENVIEKSIKKLGVQLWAKYGQKSNLPWAKSESYRIPFADEKRLSIIFTVNIMHPQYPSLSIWDQAGATFDLESGNPLTLRQLIPVSYTEWDIVIEKLTLWAKDRSFNMNGVDGKWSKCYLDGDVIVIYRHKPWRQSGYESIDISIEQIQKWASEKDPSS